MTGPLLAICVPTYNRAGALRQLLARLDDELPTVGGVAVLISCRPTGRRRTSERSATSGG
jgi:hypothetical protein